MQYGPAKTRVKSVTLRPERGRDGSAGGGGNTLEAVDKSLEKTLPYFELYLITIRLDASKTVDRLNRGSKRLLTAQAKNTTIYMKIPRTMTSMKLLNCIILRVHIFRISWNCLRNVLGVDQQLCNTVHRLLQEELVLGNVRAVRPGLRNNVG